MFTKEPQHILGRRPFKLGPYPFCWDPSDAHWPIRFPQGTHHIFLWDPSHFSANGPISLPSVGSIICSLRPTYSPSWGPYISWVESHQSPGHRLSKGPLSFDRSPVRFPFGPIRFPSEDPGQFLDWAPTNFLAACPINFKTGASGWGKGAVVPQIFERGHGCCSAAPKAGGRFSRKGPVKCNTYH